MSVTWKTFPPALMRAAEVEGYLAECDQGFCGRETVGWAFWREEGEEPEWFAGCAMCLRKAAMGGKSVVFLTDIEACFAVINAEVSERTSAREGSIPPPSGSSSGVKVKQGEETGR